MPHAFAYVQIRVDCKSNWGKDTTIEQISKQAKEDALRQLSEAFTGRADMKITGTPKITAVHTQLNDDE